MTGEGKGPFLFDPLPPDEGEADEQEAESDSSTRATPPPARKSRRPQQVLFEEPATDEPDEPKRADRRTRWSRGPRDAGRVSALGRLTSGLIDLAAMLAVVLLALIGTSLLGITPNLRLLPGVVLFVVTFSFVYHVFSLLFWGRTPGMASADLITRDSSGQTLTAWQSTLRWAGSLGTVIFAGIPMIVSWFTGWSLADLVSGSETRVSGR